MKATIAVYAAVLHALAIAQVAVGGLRSRESTDVRKLSTDQYEEIYFTEVLSGDEEVVILDEGPFKFTASCKTIEYDYSYYYYSSSYTSTPMSYTSSSTTTSTSTSQTSTPTGSTHYYSPSSSSTHYHPYYTSSSSCHSQCYNPCSSSTSWGSTSSGDDDGGSYSYGFDSTSSTPNGPCRPYTSSDTSSSSDDFSFYYGYDDDFYSYGYIYTESIAALELTYTAPEADYLYGSPSYVNYPNEVALIGTYEAGESRTQTVFAGRDGGWGDDSTLQSLSGYYVTINGDRTIGIHKDWTLHHPRQADSFPEGVDCMMAGIITYVIPE